MDDRFRQQGQQAQQDQQDQQNLPAPAGNQYQSLAPQQYNNGAQSQIPTLPPIQGNASSFAPMYGHHNNGPQSSLGAHAPSSSAHSTNTTASMPSIQQLSLRPLQPTPQYYSMNGSSYSSSQSAVMPTASAHNNPLQFASTSLAPGMSTTLGLNAHPQMYPHSMLPNPETEQPTHVVGSQGRRGVLPTLPGRPTPVPGRIPINTKKDKDGKFPCDFCPKTYLHLKHLKRHMLRHTGERPYSCILCKDTFSRSDILKRHFQKCSIRRGNPTGASHLQHAQSHLPRNRRQSQGANNFLAQPNTSMPYADPSYNFSMPMTGMNPMQATGNGYTDGLPGMSAHQPMSTRTSRSNSLIRPGTGVEDNRRAMPANTMDYGSSNLNAYQPQHNQNPGSISGNSNHYNFDNTVNHPEMSRNGSPIKNEDTSSSPYPMRGHANGLTNGQDNSMRWNGTAFSGDQSNTFNGNQGNFAMNSSMTSDEPSHDSIFSGFNASGFVMTPFVNNWVPGSSSPLQNKAEALLSFCYPGSSSFALPAHETSGYNTLKRVLTAESLNHFLEQFQNFHSHWPIVHMPSFSIEQADNGLVFAMVCIGAVYSDRLGMDDVRWLMELGRRSIYRSSRIYKMISQGSPGVQDSYQGTSDVQEVQALVLIHILFVWHGGQQQRRQGRDEFGVLVRVVRLRGLLKPLPEGHPNYSHLHQPGPLNQDDINAWTWTSWIEQEQRARTMYLILLMDAALTTYFNASPQFDIYEVKLPLPADDAAWEARSSEDCAGALGLRGAAALAGNTTGSKRAKQMEMAEALQSLYQGRNFGLRATNVYSKFILVHALLVQVCIAQRHNISVERQNGYSPLSSTSSSTTQSLQALELWKRMWDADMQLQYPGNEPRVGFCRDGIHFYFLARVFLASSRREEWAAPADIRCRQVFSLMKKIRAHITTDSAQKGLDPGSVATVDDSFAVADLTLNMKLLFTPIVNADS